MQETSVDVFEASKAVIEQAKGLTVQGQTARKQAADLWDALRAFRKQAEWQMEREALGRWKFSMNYYQRVKVRRSGRFASLGFLAQLSN